MFFSWRMSYFLMQRRGLLYCDYMIFIFASRNKILEHISAAVEKNHKRRLGSSLIGSDAPAETGS